MYGFSRFTLLHCLLWWVSNVMVVCSQEVRMNEFHYLVQIKS
jgi:hypothetical protein